MLSRPAFVLAPVAVESFPRLLAEDQSHLSSRAATACKARATTTRHPRARVISCHPNRAYKSSASDRHAREDGCGTLPHQGCMLEQ